MIPRFPADDPRTRYHGMPPWPGAKARPRPSKGLGLVTCAALWGCYIGLCLVLPGWSPFWLVGVLAVWGFLELVAP